MIPASKQLFQVNKAPSAARIPLSVRERGMAPSKIPAGQIHLQNQGSPIPTSFRMVIGNIITNTIKMRYLSLVSTTNFLVLNFLEGIL